MELSDVESDVVTVDAVPVALGERVELLGLLPGADVIVQDEVRAEDLRVVHADAAVGVQVVRVEEAPLRRPGGDLAATLIGIPVLEREVEAVGSPAASPPGRCCSSSGSRRSPGSSS